MPTAPANARGYHGRRKRGFSWCLWTLVDGCKGEMVPGAASNEEHKLLKLYSFESFDAFKCQQECQQLSVVDVKR
jgi:hypothetical protein